VEPYLAKMIRAGFKVAICEQMENPKYAKGVVRREVVRVITPGTVVEENILDNKANNYLVAIFAGHDAYGLAALEFSTGEFSVAEFRGRDAARLMKRMGVELESLEGVEEVLIKHPSRSIVIRKPEVSVMKVGGQRIFQITGEVSEAPVEIPEFDEEDIGIVAEQSGATLEEAREALRLAGGDLAKAILNLKSRREV
ncbi:MAG: nascent polypeptide-associated complex protein, partial [Candidatus Bathyarchaeia archaeon]